MKRLDHYWYSHNPVAWLLAPLSLLFCALVLLRRGLYRAGVLRSHKPPLPVVVVGNITVGGSGKTPLVVWLAEQLRQQGLRPGLVSRGYGGQASHWPQPVTAQSEPRLVGDEALLLVRRTGLPMAVGPDRMAAVALLAEHTDVDVIIADDGMQHYRMGRRVEIAVLDGERRLGNGMCLPAGPLREPAGRLRHVDMVVTNGGEAGAGEWPMSLQVEGVRTMTGMGFSNPLSTFAGRQAHAVAGIGNPQRFFNTLRAAGVEVIEHPFADHHRFSEADFAFDDGLPILMTEKDAVKCHAFADERFAFVTVSAELPQGFLPRLLECLERDKDG